LRVFADFYFGHFILLKDLAFGLTGIKDCKAVDSQQMAIGG
jgi:hypothetical protein